MEMLFILLYALIVWIAIEIAVKLFEMTGLKKAVARYQVISMLTSTGFTTEESALIIDHPIRRRISAGLILFGYFSLAVMISAIATLLSNDLRLPFLGVTIAFLLLILLILRMQLVKRHLTKVFDDRMEEQFNLEDKTLRKALNLSDDEMVAMVQVNEEADQLGRSYCDLVESGADIRIVFVKRGDIVLRQLDEEQLAPGDEFMVFGEKKVVLNTFRGMLKSDEENA